MNINKSIGPQKVTTGCQTSRTKKNCTTNHALLATPNAYQPYKSHFRFLSTISRTQLLKSPQRDTTFSRESRATIHRTNKMKKGWKNSKEKDRKSRPLAATRARTFVEPLSPSWKRATETRVSTRICCLLVITVEGWITTYMTHTCATKSS